MPFLDLAVRVAEVRERIRAAQARGGHRQDVMLVAVTKTHGSDAVRAAYDAGVHDCGENRVQEAEAKMAGMDVPIRWHLIGHLQRNKAAALGAFSLFHALDSSRLASAVSTVGLAQARAVDALLQVNVLGERSKGGFATSEVRAEAERLTTLAGVRLRGVMTMAPLGADERTLRAAFAGAREALQVLRDVGHPAGELSMGMSNDYEVAVEEGSTMVRLGTALFGARDA